MLSLISGGLGAIPPHAAELSVPSRSCACSGAFRCLASGVAATGSGHTMHTGCLRLLGQGAQAGGSRLQGLALSLILHDMAATSRV